MQISIKIEEKKAFLRWFLKKFTCQWRRSCELLHYILSEDVILEHVHFVRHVHRCPRALIISSDCSANIPFLYKHLHLETTDLYQTFHDIRLHRREPLFMQINFAQAHQSPMYVAVLEDNPYVNEEAVISEQFRISSQIWLDAVVHKANIQFLQKQIDAALDSRNYEQFKTYVQQLDDLNRSTRIKR